MRWPSKPNPELDALLKRAVEIENAKTPLQRAIGHMQSKRSYVAAEMSDENKSKDEWIARLNETHDEFIVLSELERRMALDH